MTVPDAYAGKSGRCKSCGMCIVAPSLAAPAPAVVAHDDFIDDDPPPKADAPAGPQYPAPPLPPPVPGLHAPYAPAGPGGAYVTPSPPRQERRAGFRDFCAVVAGSLGGFWPVLGWILFFSPGVTPFVLYKLPDYAMVALLVSAISGPLFLFWWIVDAVDQGLETGQIVLCFFLVTFCGWAGWLYYCVNVRD